MIIVEHARSTAGKPEGKNAEMAKEPAKKNSGEVEKFSTFQPEELAEIKTFDQALTLLADKIGEDNIHVVSDVLGDGFRLIDDKDTLIGIPMLLVTWEFRQGDFGEYVSVKAITAGDNRKVVFNDGSTGIRDQLRRYSEKTNKTSGLMCPHGLRVSRYDFTDESTGQTKSATTYYIDTSV